MNLSRATEWHISTTTPRFDDDLADDLLADPLIIVINR
jgi:hypothetical protein